MRLLSFVVVSIPCGLCHVLANMCGYVCCAYVLWLLFAQLEYTHSARAHTHAHCCLVYHVAAEKCLDSPCAILNADGVQVTLGLVFSRSEATHVDVFFGVVSIRRHHVCVTMRVCALSCMTPITLLCTMTLCLKQHVCDYSVGCLVGGWGTLMTESV